MTNICRRIKLGVLLLVLVPVLFFVEPAMAQTAALIGKEISVPMHLQDGENFRLASRS